jgi:phosphohistidine phosphatase
MKQFYLIRHAKSSWSDPVLDDFDRPLNKRGKKNCPEMAGRLAALGVCPDLIVSSPARRAKSTARCMAKGTSYKRSKIIYYDDLYIGSLSFHLQMIDVLLNKVNVLFMVGHNHVFTELAEYLTGKDFGNVPTCGVVAIGYSGKERKIAKEGAGKLLFFDFPKKDVSCKAYKLL